MDFSQITQIAPFIACFAILYFIVLRPQQQKMKKHREILASLKRGDQIVLGGGIEAVVEDAPTDSSVVRASISPGVSVSVRRDLILEVVEAKQNKT
ncbi:MULTISPECIES: preprotein translocase subunit YajC [Holospora]|uniref:Sec translocon accessory complex subunit YajC n=2 Tax=Holospora TaxID=44747 RepID=A0A061JHL1_9PROT|nr:MULTISPECIES: preprotein translocase subunit YajC [Holospora]ETZ04833.1 immunogenic membrane protein YajC [Holospora undulata HU1]GAJ46370.1 immunogenic membrane protein YajC [Holospora elegans E1]